MQPPKEDWTAALILAAFVLAALLAVVSWALNSEIPLVRVPP